MSDIPPETLETIHTRALDLLSQDGMQVEHDAARQQLADAGATVEGEMVRISADLVEAALESAPEEFVWRARDPEKRVVVGSGDPVVAPTRGPRYVKRPGTERHRATMEDFERLVKLAHQEPTIDVVGYDLCSPEGYSLPGNPGGFEKAAVGDKLLEVLFTGTDKPIVGSARKGAEAAKSLEMARIAFDEPELTEPSVLGILCIRSPRVFNEPIVSGMMEFARAGQPLVISSGAIPGASAPHSLSEAAVQATAESLFGVVFVQLLNPGTPVVFGATATTFDRAASAASAGIPGSGLQPVMVAMADRYGLPSRGSGAGTDAKTIDEQSGTEATYHLAMDLDSGADLVLNATGGLDAFATVSPEKTVLDAERIRLIRGVQAEEESLLAGLESEPSLETIRDAGPGASFFDGRDPATLADSTPFEETIGIRGGHAPWVDAGRPSAVDRATERVETKLADYERPAIDPAVAQGLQAAVED